MNCISIDFQELKRILTSSSIRKTILNFIDEYLEFFFLEVLHS